jgi:hypothetical protein
MTSSINPNNIDGAYPVAGQDNNSQGFRDNFTNTKTNFAYAASEITDLQNKAVLKAALTGSTLNNDMLGSILSNATIQDFGATRVALGTLSGTVTVNYAAGHFQTVTTAASISLAFTNFLAAGVLNLVTVQISVASAAHTVTIPAAVSINTTGVRGLNTSTNTITFATSGVYTFTFTTSDGGTTIILNEVNKALQPFNNSQEDLAASAAISLATTVSYFSTAGSETATLADGVEGQIKTLICTSYVGDMVVTVATAGWKTSGGGTITFGADGRACTLQYVQGAWYCIGNNAAVFA